MEARMTYGWLKCLVPFLHSFFYTNLPGMLLNHTSSASAERDSYFPRNLIFVPRLNLTQKVCSWIGIGTLKKLLQCCWIRILDLEKELQTNDQLMGSAWGGEKLGILANSLCKCSRRRNPVSML